MCKPNWSMKLVKGKHNNMAVPRTHLTLLYVTVSIPFKVIKVIKIGNGQ